MFLEKIDIQGFKSFANPVTLIFNRQLTAVVGPNGSGKSNVADSIRWVLGEQSLKLLRGKKSDDVIFAGSDKKGRLGFARVAIHLNNTDRRANIDYEAVTIERTVDRSGESEYLLNGSKARLADIQLLLARAAVGQKSYSVIGQGTIDSLLVFSAQERRDFFDEATGVRQFQMKKNQALQKLDHTEENLTQAELVLQELEPRLRTLTRQVRRLERKETLEKELHELQTHYYSYLTTQLNNDLAELYQKKDSAEHEYTALQTSLASVQEKLDEHERLKSRDERFSELQRELYQAQNEHNALTKKRVILEGQADLAVIKAGGGDSIVLKQRAEEIENKLAHLRAEEKNLAETLATAARRRTALNAQMEKSAAHLATLEQELSRRSSHIDWNILTREAEMIAREHQTIHQKLFEAKTVEDFQGMRATHKTFTEKLLGFLETIKKQGASDNADRWKEFSLLKTTHDKLVRDLHEAELSETINQRNRETTAERITELEREYKSVAHARSDSASERKQMAIEGLQELQDEIAKKEGAMKLIRTELDGFNQQEEQTKQELMDLQKKFRTIQYDQTIKNNALTSLKVDIAKLETRKEELDKEIAQEASTLTFHELTELNAPQTKEMIETAKRQLAIIGGIDAETVSEYKEVNEKYTFLSQQTTDLRQAQKSLNGLIDELDEHIQKQFESGFKNINAMFSKYFRKLFNGGNAKLVLQIQQPTDDTETEEEPSPEDEINEKKTAPKRKKHKTFDYTVDIQATPPGKKLSSIAMLSGGEKALTSISLICAIIAQNPPPFVVLDEVDAALDEANSIRFAEIISELTDRTQFVTITHNRATMHQAKILYGITMGDDGISKLLSVNFEEADKLSPS